MWVNIYLYITFYSDADDVLSYSQKRRGDEGGNVLWLFFFLINIFKHDLYLYLNLWKYHINITVSKKKSKVQNLRFFPKAKHLIQIVDKKSNQQSTTARDVIHLISISIKYFAPATWSLKSGY